MPKIKIIHVDDSVIFHNGLMLCLEKYDKIEVIYYAETGEQLFNYLRENEKPDLILLDYKLPDTNGIAITKKIKSDYKYDNVKIIILSGFNCATVCGYDYKLVIEALDAGVNGYVLKESTKDDIYSAINIAMSGGTFYFGETINVNEINKIFVNEIKTMISLLKKKRNFGLTQQQIDVIKMLSEGHSAKEIAEKESVTEATINTRKDNARKELETNYGVKIRNATELVVWAIKNKIIEI